MRRTILLACSLTALAAACGSQTVGPTPDDAAVLPDGAPTPGVDVVNPPPRVDGAVPDAAVPPTPPDAATPPRDLCARACDRAARDCGRADPSCLSGCTDSVARLPPMCAPRFAVLAECLVTNGFQCGPRGTTEPSAACRPAFDDLQRCLGETPPPPPPPPLDGGTAPDYPGCAAACDQITRACGAAKPDCVANCSGTGFEARMVCPGVFDTFLMCLDRNAFTCVDGNPAVPAACADLSAQLEMCLGGGGGGDPPPVPPTADGGAPRPDV